MLNPFKHCAFPGRDSKTKMENHHFCLKTKIRRTFSSVQFSSVQLFSCIRLFVTPWIAARQASLSITNSQSLLKLKSIESVMSSNHLIHGRPLLLLPPTPPSIRVFSNELTLRMRWPKYWSFSFSIFFTLYQKRGDTCIHMAESFCL